MSTTPQMLCSAVSWFFWSLTKTQREFLSSSVVSWSVALTLFYEMCWCRWHFWKCMQCISNLYAKQSVPSSVQYHVLFLLLTDTGNLRMFCRQETPIHFPHGQMSFSWTEASQSCLTNCWNHWEPSHTRDVRSADFSSPYILVINTLLYQKERVQHLKKHTVLWVEI